MEQRIKGTTGLLALIGSPVGHSGSPDMYNFCFRYHNLDYCYMAFDIKEDQVPAALDAMRLFNMRGCNVTMPCKTAAAQNMDELSAAARIIGAVNTIVNENGKLVGHMTDGIGFVENLRDHGVDVKGKKMVVLGAGGAATAIQVQCALDGAASISIFNPNDPFLDRAKNTAAKLKKEVPDCDVQVFCIEDQDKLKEEIAKADIKKNLEEKKADAAKRAKEDAAVDAAVANATMEIPDAMLDTQVNQMIDDFARRMQSQGLTMDQYMQFTGTTLASLQEQMKPQALKRIQTRLVLEKIAEAEAIEIADEKIDEEINKMAEMYKMEADKLKEMLGDAEKEQMKKDMAVQEAVTILADAAKEVEKTEE